MGKKLNAAPVFFTIMQVRFNPILTLDAYVPQIQDRLRKEGFPDAQKGFVATINLTLGGAPSAEGSPAQIPIAQTPRITFGNRERTAAFILDQGAISFQTTQYDVFETFLADFMKGLEAVHQAVTLDFTDRLGLRYLDAVFPKTGEAVKDYLSGSILGLTEKLNDTIVHSFSETLVKREDIQVRSRVIIQDSELSFPPDLMGLNLSVPDRFRGLNGRHALIDTDGWSDAREAFSLDRIKERFDSIHDGITTTFKASVTPNALKVWA
ncbi:MAG TPA: TIGR04255 family protein [Terriglobales bacterium]|jgi:uncharacterized protein (TIGR04255 family)|nr:TIGR04255 family protein [Terriglobales bacterium]